MRLFLLVLVAVGVFYPLATRPSLRPVAFCAMMLFYAGVGAVWWNEHDCHLNASSGTDWNLALLARTPHDVSCRVEGRHQFAGLVLTSAH